MLPTKTQVFLLFEYHADWLLFMHFSFYAPTFRRELDQFYSHDEEIISITSTGMDIPFVSIICSSMSCAKPAQIAGCGFRPDIWYSLIPKQSTDVQLEIRVFSGKNGIRLPPTASILLDISKTIPVSIFVYLDLWPLTRMSLRCPGKQIFGACFPFTD
jgi:hypothetical protein